MKNNTIGIIPSDPLFIAHFWKPNWREQWRQCSWLWGLKYKCNSKIYCGWHAIVWKEKVTDALLQVNSWRGANFVPTKFDFYQERILNITTRYHQSKFLQVVFDPEGNKSMAGHPTLWIRGRIPSKREGMIWS